MASQNSTDHSSSRNEESSSENHPVHQPQNLSLLAHLALPCLPAIPQNITPTPQTLPFTATIIPENEASLVTINNLAQTPTKLSPTNYQMWYSQWRSLLLGYNLSSYVLNQPTSVQMGSMFWLRQDQLLRSALVASLTVEVAPFVLSDDSSYKVWKTLSNLYAKVTKSQLMVLKDSLYRIVKGNESMSAYLQRVKNIVSLINSSGSSVMMDDVLLHVLQGLPSEYDNLSSSIRSRPDDVSFDELHRLLIDQEAIILRNQSTFSAPVVANFAPVVANFAGHGSAVYPRPFSAPKSNSSSSQFRPSTHSVQQSSGHKLQSGIHTITHRDSVICQYCDKPGHISKRCWKLFPHLKPHGSGFKGNKQANVVANVPSSPQHNDASWLVDSGASHHVTADLQNLSVHDTYAGGEDIMLGDGSAYGGASGARES